MQVNVKEFVCNSYLNYLELVLMNVLVLQSFLAVPINSRISFLAVFTVLDSPVLFSWIQSIVFELPSCI